MKAHSKLIVDSYPVLPFPVSLESLKPIRWRYSQVLKGTRSLELIQLSQRHFGNIGPLPVLARGEQLEGVRLSEADDHTYIV